MKTEWISLNKRYPDVDQWVLVFNGKWIGIGKYSPLIGSPEYCHWQDEVSQFIPNPTHWMPLPPKP